MKSLRQLWSAHRTVVLAGVVTFLVGLVVVIVALVLSAPAPQALKRGRVVVYRATPQAVKECNAKPGSYHLARLIGLPGDVVYISTGGVVSVDERALVEPYIKAPPPLPGHILPAGGTWHVPKGEYFLLDDNRTQGCDSRTFGYVPADYLKR